MAQEGPSSSSSSFNHGWIYDVFVSFTGEDTRYSFTGNLCHALDQKGIHTFRDDIKLRKGDNIAPSLLKAIEESRISIIVFSENYASSSWCLDELVKIIECMKEKGQMVRPVFYYVDPSDVRHQRASFGRSMAMHEAKLMNGNQTLHEQRIALKRLHTWRVALREAANLSGWHFKNGYEFEFIQKITEEISSKLNYTLLHIADYPVGLKYRILQVMSLLSIKSKKDALMVGLHGIGGIGKTTIARAVYNSIGNQFEASCFLADVRGNSMKHGLVQLQKTLLSNLLGENTIDLSNESQGIPILENRLRRKKVLLILDDVDNLKQLRSLAGSEIWFGSGSRIIITTRDKHLLTLHGIEKLYEVKELNDDESLELFSWNAFKRSEPDQRYMEIAKLVVQYAKGLPLALNVIGCDLFGKTIEEWTSALKKYERIPSKEILDVLKVSYDNLDDNEKEIFLDIACFLEGSSMEDVEKTLDASRFYSKYGIGVLRDKSLVTIDQINLVRMHDLIKDLGKDIARKDSPFDPAKRRRLWHHEDVLEVLTKSTGSDSIEGILLDMSNLEQEVKLNANAFKRMKRLRILIVRNAQVSEAPKYLPNNLRLLEWTEYPSPSFPDDFHPQTLVVLDMPHSHLTMDQPFKKFENLTLMNFSDCDSITRIPDVSAIPNLTRLLTNNCPKLAEIHESVGNLGKLVTLSTQNCPILNNIPQSMTSTSLESLNLANCSTIQSFPNMLTEKGNMKNIDIKGTAIKKFPDSIEKVEGLEELVLASCIEDLPTDTNMFQNTEELNVEDCPQLPKLLGKALMELDPTNWTPKLNRLVLKNCDLSDEDLELIMGSFMELKWLVLSNNKFVTIPECIEDLGNLLFLHVDDCKQLRHISVLPQYLQYIDARNCISLTPYSSDVLLSQAFHEVENIDIVVPRKKIPNWFDHCSKGRSVAFWVRRKFPRITVFFLLGGNTEADTNFLCEFSLLINGLQVFQRERHCPIDHVWLFDLRTLSTAKEWHNLNEQLHQGWNHVEILCSIKNDQTHNGKVKCCGIHLYKDRMNIHDVSFINPDLHGSDMAYKNMDNNDSDIYDEESNDVAFRQVLAKYFDKKIINLMEGLRSSRRQEDDDKEEEQRLNSINNETIERHEVVVKDKGKGIEYSENPEEKQSEHWMSRIPDQNDSETWDLMIMESLRGAKSREIFLGPSATEAEVEADPLVTSIHYKQPMLEKTGKLKENGKVVLGSTSSASTSTDRGNRVNGSKSNIKISESIALANRQQKLQITAKSNAEAVKSHVRLLETRANQQSEGKATENVQISMDAFYASLEAETMALSNPQNTQTSTVSINTKPSEETQKALQILQDLVSKKFSLLLQPKTSKLMRDILDFLLSLTPEDGISQRTKSVIQQISRGFTEWGVDYNDARFKFESANAEMSQLDEVKKGVEDNVREFREVEELEMGIWSQLDSLEERKRVLEEQINAIKAEIADFNSAKEEVAKRKRQVFENGRMMKARRDDLRNRVPRLRAEEEWANIIQTNTEDEWSKLGEEFIQSFIFEE